MDAFVFNIYPSSFGRANVANAIGLLTPTLVRILSGKQVITYLHNIIETQDIASLGYPAGRLTMLGARVLESLLNRTTIVRLPLSSQVTRARELFGPRVAQLFIPFIEAAYSSVVYNSKKQSQLYLGDATSTPRFRVLLFGFFGPQKDFDAAIRVLSGPSPSLADLEVTVAGAPNPNFPASSVGGKVSKSKSSSERLKFIGPVPEEGVFALFKAHDVVILPYTSSGGYSGVMNIAAAAGVRVIAQDLPQLRETAAILGLEVAWVKGDDPEGLVKAISMAKDMYGRSGIARGPVAPDILRASLNAVDDLLSTINQVQRSK